MTATALATVPDPLLYTQELPRLATLFPLGQAVRIATNSAAIEAAAHSLWSRYPRLFESDPMTFRVAVADHDSASPERKSAVRGQGHLVSLIRDGDNFAVVDLLQGFGFAWLTRDVAADRPAVIDQFLEPAIYLMVSARHFAQVHASCVALNGRAVLLCGDSGAGKTCLSYFCARRGWHLISGDAIQIIRSSGGKNVVGRPYSLRFRESARRLFPELDRFAVTRSQSGKLDVAMDTADLALDTALEGEASIVVFLDQVGSGAEPVLSEVQPEEALAYFDQVVFYGDEVLRTAQRASLAELATLPIRRLTYSDFPGAERALRCLVNGEA